MSPSLLAQLTLLTPTQLLNVLILVVYLLTVAALFGAIVYTLPRPKPGDERMLARGVFALGTVASGAHTWYYMIKFLQHSYYAHLAAYPPALGTPTLVRIAAWLSNTSLFDEAWRHVFSTPLNTWWSAHITLYALPWTTFIVAEGQRHSIPHLWLYPILGQLMAMSTASALFFLALFSAPALDPPVPRPRLRLEQYLPILGAVFPVLYTPYLIPEGFMPNLLLLHSLLLIPFLPIEKIASALGLPAPTPAEESSTTLGPSAVLSILEATSFLIRSGTIRALPSGGWRDVHALWQVLHSHPAQASIGWDAMHVSLLLILYSLLRRGAWPTKAGAYEALGALAGILAVGPGVVAPLVFRGGVRDRKRKTVKGKNGEKYGQLLKEEMPLARRTRSGRMYSDVVVGKS